MDYLKKKKLQRILVVTLTNLGDVVITLPALAAIRAAYPHAELGVVVGPRAYDLLKDNPHFAEVVIYDKTASLQEKLTFILHLMSRRYDFVLDFRNSMIPYLLGRPSRTFSFNQRIRSIESRYKRMDAVYSFLGIEPVAASALPLCTKTEYEGLLLKLRTKGVFAAQSTMVVSPGARLPLKRWLPEYFARTIDALGTRYGMTTVLVGDADEILIAQEVMAHVKEAEVISLVGKLTQKELAALIEKARLVLSNDSAVMHIANYYNRPVIAFFGPTNPAKYGKQSSASRIVQVTHECRACEASLCPKSIICFQSLVPEQAIHVAQELLGPPS